MKYPGHAGILASVAVSLFGVFALLAPASMAEEEGVRLAFLHDSHPHHESSHHGHGRGHGCFVTTSPQHAARGVRHWRSPCPHHDPKHLNPYHPHHHRHNPLPKHHSDHQGWGFERHR